MKHLFYFLGCMLPLMLSSQIPGIQWQRSIGGSENDVFACVKPTPDGGFIVAGNSFSSDGFIAKNQGSADLLVVKTNRVGLVEWSRTLGGSKIDKATDIEVAHDGNYVILGSTNSADGDLSSTPASGIDYWLVKLDAAGNLLWHKVFKVTTDGPPADLMQDTVGKGFYILGSKNKKPFQLGGDFDLLLIKTDKDGESLWESTYTHTGAGDNEFGMSLIQLNNGNLLLAGTIIPAKVIKPSPDSVFSLKITGDYLFFEVDTSGHYIKSARGNVDCWGDAGSMIINGTNRLVGILSTCSTLDCNSVLSNGRCDYFIYKQTASNFGTERYGHFGGTYSDMPTGIIQTSDKQYLIAGTSYSSDGDIDAAQYRGGSDIWLIQTKESGTTGFAPVVTRNIGSSANDGANAILQTAPGEYLIAGYSAAADGDVTKHYGEQDAWLVKLGPVCPPASTPARPVLTLKNQPCNTDYLEFAATAYAGAKVTYFWSTPRGVVETNAPGLIVNGVQPGPDDGLYALLVEVDGCVSLLSEALDLAVIRDSAHIRTENQTVCSANFGAVLLEADSARAPLSGVWRLPAGAGLADAGAPITAVAALAPGLDTLVWTLSYPPYCPDFSSDTLLLYYETGLVARTDSVSVGIPGNTVSIPVLQNDALQFIQQPELVSFNPPQPAVGTVRQTGPGTLEYSGTLLNGETLHIAYELCSAECPALCDVGTVVVTGLSDLRIPGGITPGDGNGINDYWFIEGLPDARFSDNELIIVNRWGERVYHKTGYQNDWDGGDLPEGVYYYLLKLKSVNRTYEGSIHLFR